MLAKVVLSLFVFVGSSPRSWALVPSCPALLSEAPARMKQTRTVLDRVAKLAAVRLVGLGLGLGACVVPAAAQAPDANPPARRENCERRPTDVIGALEFWRDAWKVAERGWTVSTGEDSTRSPYEIYSRYDGLGFVLGLTPERIMRQLTFVGRAAPTVQSGWNWEDYSRMGEAAIVRGASIQEAMLYLKAVWDLEPGTWAYLDYSRAAAAGFIAGAEPEEVIAMLGETYGMTRGWWTSGTFSRLAEGALISKKSAAEAAQMLDEVYAHANQISSGWNDNDYSRISRAALIKGISAKSAVVTLDQTYRAISKRQWGWSYRDFSRMATAAIITGKSPDEAAEALVTTYDKSSISSGWYQADYATMAAAALIGRGLKPKEESCPAFTKAW